MTPRSAVAFMVLQMLLAGGSQPLPAASSVQSQGNGSVSRVETQAGGRVEAVVSGRNAVIDVNGDHVEIDDGRLTLNGVSYGRVREGSTVIFRLAGGKKTLLVDDRLRHPVEAR